MKPEYHTEVSREDITHTYMHIGLNDYSELFEPALAHSLTALMISDDLLNIDITIYRLPLTLMKYHLHAPARHENTP